MSHVKDARRDPIPLRWLDCATQGLNIVGSVLILVLMLLVGVDVVGRNLLGAPVSGVPELVTLSIVAIVFFQVPAALLAGRMTRSDGVINWLSRRSPGLGKALETLFDVCGAAVISIIVYASWPIFTRAFERAEFVGAVGDFTAPVWPVKLALIVGGSVLSLQFLARIYRRFA